MRSAPIICLWPKAHYNGDRLRCCFFPPQNHALPDEIMKLCQKSIGPLVAAALVCLIGAPVCGAEKSKTVGAKELSQSLQALLAVKTKGVGNVAASEAWQKVAAADPSQLTVVLAAMDGAQPLAANWIAAAVETIADRQLKQGKLPADKLEAFVLDTQHAPRARRLAFEWLVRGDKTAADRLTPGFLYDPSPELRRDAVARLIDEADALLKAEETDKAHKVYDKALSGACDLDQVKKLKEALEKLGEKVDLPKHFGFITRWKLIGPFDNTAEKALDVAYPPEQSVDLAAEYEGKPNEGKPQTVQWVDHETTDDYGVVDFNKALLKANGVTAYAWGEFESPAARTAEVRLGSANAAKIWLNGKLVHVHAVYHSGSSMDQYAAPIELKQGRNTLLVKILQNEQKEEWAQTWNFQLRICDATGAAIKGGK